MKASLLITLTLCVSLGQSQLVTLIPLLPTPPGFSLGGNLGAQIQVEAFLNLMCPDSAAAYPNLTRITEEYDPDDVRVVIQHFPLPYLRNSFIVTQGFYLVEQEAPDNLKAYMELMLDHTANYSTQNTRHLSEDDVVSLIAAQQEPVTGISRDVFSGGVNNSTFRSEGIYTWKYAARRGAAGTPWYFINGIEISADPNSSTDFEDWKATLDYLLGREPTDEGNDEHPNNPDDATHHHDNTPIHHDNTPPNNQKILPKHNLPPMGSPPTGNPVEVFAKLAPIPHRLYQGLPKQEVHKVPLTDEVPDPAVATNLNTALNQVFDTKGFKSPQKKTKKPKKISVNSKDLMNILAQRFRAMGNP